MLDQSAYRYWDGAAWSPDVDTAKTIVPGPVGELSVQWNAYYRTWIMTYLNDDDSSNAVVLRTAPSLAGP